MATSTKRNERVDLEKVAEQLASVHILPIAGEEQITLKATAKFTTKTFVAGKYKVSVGIQQALLRLDYPSFELEDAYQATLPKETWSQVSKYLRASNVGGHIEAKLGARLLGLVGITAKGQAGKERRESAEQKASAPYPLVSITPTGWQIATELGDPRVPDGALPQGLEHCLFGEYLSGRNGEHGEGHKDKTGAFALCVLKPKPGGNDPSIVATLSGTSGSLIISIDLSEPTNSSQSTFQSQNEIRDREETLRRAFVEICIQRAAQTEGARADTMLSGEFFLNNHKTYAPKLAQKASAEIHTKTKGQST